MPSLNRIQIQGNAGKDPELKTGQSGKPYCRFSVAVTKGKDKAATTTWFDVVILGFMAEECARDVRKGDAVSVEGELEIKKWKDKTGQERTQVEIVAFSYWARPKRAQPTQKKAPEIYENLDETPF